MKATCVLLTHKRLGNFERIIDALLETPEIADIKVWSNYQPERMDLWRKIIERYSKAPIDLMCEKEGANFYTYGRYRAAGMAKCGTVCTQDDDVLVTPEKWRRLFEKYEERPEDDRRLVCYLDRGHVKWGVAGRRYAHKYIREWDGLVCEAHETLVGWGAVFERVWVHDVFAEYFAVPLVDGSSSMDEFAFRKADRIFTVMLDRPHEHIEDEPEHLPGASGSEALYRQPGHWEDNKRAVQRALYVLRTRP